MANSIANKKIFLVFENRYRQLAALLANENYKQKIMGEIIWFSSIIHHLRNTGHQVLHCSPYNFAQLYSLHRDKKEDFILLMDRYTIQKTMNLIKKDINRVFCMCIWGKTSDDLNRLGISALSCKQVLTQFDYGLSNTYLGFDMSVLCPYIEKNKYKPFGLLWGKDIEYINIPLVTFLTSKGMKFYTVSQTKLNLENVTDLGILSKSEWTQLLHDTTFLLGSGNPKSGTSILEALYYKTAIVAPRYQIPECVDNNNVHLIDGLQPIDIFNLLNNISFVEDHRIDTLVSVDMLSERIENIFYRSII